jgi:Cu2+-exporting ATPase
MNSTTSAFDAGSLAASPFVTGPGDSAATRNKPQCRHCGAPLLDERMRESGFCCAGCGYVFRLVHEHGLEGYYRIKDEVTAPADATVLQLRDFSWLAAAQKTAEAAVVSVDGETQPGGRPRSSSRIPELTLDVQGISCAGCVWLIERVFQQQPGARDILANAQLGQVRIRWIIGEFSAEEFARKLQAFGYLLGPAGESAPTSESHAVVKRIGLCAAFAMNIMLFAFPAYFGMSRDFEYASLFRLLTLGFGTLSFLVGGTFFVGRAVRALRERALHIDLPIAIGILGAYLGSVYGWFTNQERFVYFDFVGTFILLMLVGRWAQVAAVERNQRRLLRHQPKPSRIRLAAGRDVAPEQLALDQSYFVNAGQTVPVESRLESAEASFSMASINGEAEPRVFCAGQRIPSGAVSLGRLDVRLTALQVWSESLLCQLLSPSERAGARHAFLEKIIRGYLIGIIAVAVLSGIGWWWISHDAARTWAVVTAVLVVSCPCAIGLAFPLADEMATIALRRRGVFVREGDLWAKLSRVKKLVFDKTGTLTLETPVLKNSEALTQLDDSSRAALLVLVRDNPHPISQCLLENILAFSRSSLRADTPEAIGAEVHETIGYGVEVTLSGAQWSLGRPGWRTAADQASVSGADSRESGDVVFARDGEVVARFQFTDSVRPDAKTEIAQLATQRFSTFILSGDRREKVASLAAELGLPAQNALAEMTPNEKATWIEANARQDALMLGDGANDSLAFDQALCRGTPVIHRGVLEQKADFYYLGRGIGGVRALFDVNRIRQRTQLWILIFSVVYNAVAVGLAIIGQMNPLVAAILMPINSLLTLALVTGGMRAAFSR